MTALAQRAAACKGWRWMPGMLAQPGTGRTHYRLIRYENAGWQCAPDATPEERPHCLGRLEYELPDLTDPATLGCLLRLVREAWGDPGAYTHRVDGSYAPAPVGSWWCHCVTDSDVGGFNAATEAEALVAALEAAP